MQVIDDGLPGSRKSARPGPPAHFSLYRRRRDRNAARSTHAAMTHFAMLFPDWNSLDSVRRAHSELEAAALIFFALLVVFDVLAHISEDKRNEKLLEKIGLCFFGLAVLAEIAAYPYGQRNDALSAQVIGSLDIKAQRATDNASKALTDSSIALSQATDAAGIATTAKSIADEAKARAVDATRQVTNLQAQAKSLQHDIDAEREEILRLKTPRRLIDLERVTKELGEFKGTEYLFSEVGADPDSLTLLDSLDRALQEAGWKRMPAPRGYPQIEVFGGNPEYGVNISLGAGIDVSTESLNPPTSREPFSVTDPKVPAYERAAGLLRLIFSRKLYPPEENAEQKQLNVTLGKSQTVRIAIGRKP